MSLDTELAHRLGPRLLRDGAPQPPTELDDPDDYRYTPALPPVPKRKQASVLLSGFLTICLTIGYNQCYGVFQEYYLSPAQTLLNPAPASLSNPPTAALAFVGTLGAGLTWAGSIFVNPLISRIEYLASSPPPALAGGTGWRYGWYRLLTTLTTRHVTLAGVALMCAGFLLASIARTVNQLLLTQGMLFGIGSSLLYFPILGPAPEYFSAHRATAIGVILSGGGAGGLILGPALRALLASVGAAWTLRALAALCLIVGLPAALGVPASRFPTLPAADADAAGPQPIASRRLTRLPAPLLLSPALLLSAAAAFTQAAGAQLPLAFVPAYSVALGLDASTGAALLAAANAINAVARVAAGYAGDRLGRLNATVASLFGAAAAVLGLWVTSVQADGPAAVSTWLAFVVVYSLAAGGYYALFPATVADVFGIRSYAAVNGFIYFVRGCGTMLGSPVGGLLLGSKGQRATGYASLVYWDGALMLGSAACVLGVRWADALRRGWMWRA